MFTILRFDAALWLGMAKLALHICTENLVSGDVGTSARLCAEWWCSAAMLVPLRASAPSGGVQVDLT